MITDYETRKTARTNAVARDPRCAIAHFVRYFTKRGFTFSIDFDSQEENDALCTPRTKSVIEIVRAVYEIEMATFRIINPDGSDTGKWVTFMFPSACNCSPSESACDFGECAETKAWMDAWDKRRALFGC
jgi:hypothetical protein